MLRYNLYISTVLAALLLAGTSHAQDMAEVEADSMEYHEEESRVSAQGNVQVKYGNRHLTADEVSYNQETRIIDAKGDIKLLDGSGNEFRADSASINDELSKGEASNVQGKLVDNASVAAQKTIRQSKDVIVLENAAYTPCNMCTKGKLPKKPIWHIAADKVTIDEGNKKITYDNATFNLFDTPVFYTPYFSHHTPGSGRESGFLIPSYNQLSTLGITVKTPYYFNIAPEMDATLTPIFTTEEGIIMGGEFRHLTEYGQYQLEGSITNPQQRDDFGKRDTGRELRGHIEGRGRFDFEEGWAAGFDGKRASDDTYLARYRFGYEDVLTSKAYVHNILNRNYFGAKAISFQGLTPFDDPATTPLVLPLLDAHYEMPAGFHNSRFTLDGSAMSLVRDAGVDSRRLSSTLGWELPHITDNGHIIEFKTSLRGDVYSVENALSGGALKDGVVGRVIPEAQASWSYPLVQSVEGNRILIEPIVDVIASPHGGNPDKIPNEDSQEVEISDINLFTNNHFSGLDRVESGLRTNYGFRGGINNDDLGEVNFLLGQNYRAKQDQNFTPETGMDEHFSDYIGRISFTDKEFMNLAYRFRTDKNDYTMRHNEINAGLDFDAIALDFAYLSIDEDNNTFDREEALGNTRIKLTENWYWAANGRHNLKGDGQWISAGTSLAFENDCLLVSTGVRRDFIRDRDIEPSTSYMLQFSFKNLGI